ncbi:hypothetical protein FRC06_007457 [Ceratobasidium sp. 370]|nr:hypothetical protein FRC06_007457 [Ceratobasidium sp. 370]
MLDLPPELWGKILAYLRILELEQCRLVCKMFYSLTHSVPECRFRLELASAGYAEPSNPRTDISTAQATDIFRAHLSRTVSQTDDLSEFMAAGFRVDRRNGRSLSEPEIRPMFFGGVLARWSSVYSDSYLPLRMDAVRLPSSNKGTRLERWKVFEPELDVQGYWMEPKYDLLVLLVYTQNKRKRKLHLSALVIQPIFTKILN